METKANSIETFDGSEALSWLRNDSAVLHVQSGKAYKVINGELWMWPIPVENPKLRVRVKWLDSNILLNDQFVLIDDEPKAQTEEDKPSMEA